MKPDVPEFETIPLGDGVTLHHRRSHGFKSDLVRVFFRGPLDGPTAARRLFAAVRGRGTRSFPDRRALAAHLDELYGAGFGVSLSRMAGRSVLALRASTVSGRYLPGRPRNLEAIFDLLTDALAPFELDGAEAANGVFAEERELLLREYRARKNNKARYASLRLYEELFANHPLGRPDTGDETAIALVTPRDAVRAGRALIEKGEVDVYLVADCSARDAERKVGRTFRIPPRQPEAFRFASPRSVRSRVRVVREAMPLHQSRVAFGFRIDGWRRSDGGYAAVLADTVLGGGPTSRLFRNVRERRSLCYDIWSFLDRVTGTLVVGAGIDRAAFAAVRRAVREEIEGMGAGSTTDEEVRVAKAALETSIAALSDSPSGLVDTFYVRRLLGRKEASLAAVAKALAAESRAAIAPLLARARLDTVMVLDPEETTGVA